MNRLLASVALAGIAAVATNAALAAPIIFTTVLTGAAENPAVPTPGTGTATVTLDPVAHILTLDTTFSDLIGTTTVAHIHCCIAAPGNVGVATQTPSFVGFPVGVTAGSYSQSFDTTLASTWNAAFITANGGTALGAEAALLAGLEAGQAYLNIHSTFRTSGEIRGFLTEVPEPATLGLMAVGLVALAVRRRSAAA